MNQSTNQSIISIINTRAWDSEKKKRSKGDEDLLIQAVIISPIDAMPTRINLRQILIMQSSPSRVFRSPGASSCVVNSSLSTRALVEFPRLLFFQFWWGFSVYTKFWFIKKYTRRMKIDTGSTMSRERFMRSTMMIIILTRVRDSHKSPSYSFKPLFLRSFVIIIILHIEIRIRCWKLGYRSYFSRSIVPNNHSH